MWKRIVAAVFALVLASVGVLLVVAYANNADARALKDQETQTVLVASAPIAEGTAVADLNGEVEEKQVPQAYIVDGAVTSLEGLEGQLFTAAIAPGQQIQSSYLSTPEALRSAGQITLPDSAKDLHQVTVALDKARALGGNIAAGDTVGVFMSFDISGDSGFVLAGDGTVLREPSAGEEESESSDSGSGSVSTTHLTLHKVLVVRVDGAYVPPVDDSDDGEEGQAPAASIGVTLALEAPAAEQLVYAMEFGRVWLSLEPETASEDGTGVVVTTVPREARNVYQ